MPLRVAGPINGISSRARWRIGQFPPRSLSDLARRRESVTRAGGRCHSMDRDHPPRRGMKGSPFSRRDLAALSRCLNALKALSSRLLAALADPPTHHGDRVSRRITRVSRDAHRKRLTAGNTSRAEIEGWRRRRRRRRVGQRRRREGCRSGDN